jgi:Putative peptidoglycan binding domain
VRAHGFTASANRPTARIAGSTSPIKSQQDRAALLTRQNTRVANSQVAATNRQPSRTGAMAGRNRVSDPRASNAANRQSFVKNHAAERHDANNWHRDWDRHRAHFHNNRVFVFVNGFWWGLYPWDYYPYYAYGYPYDDYNSYPYDDYNGYPSDSYSGYPYSYYDSSYPSDYDDQPSYGRSQQSVANATVSAVQSELAKLGYYNGVIDGALGDETEAALARYQQDQGISVTGTVNAATLQSLGIR